MVRTQKKKKTTESAASKKNKNAQNSARMNILYLKKRSQMNKLYLVLALLFALSACSVGKKCTYTQDGTKTLILCMVLIMVDKPIDLDKNNCSLKQIKALAFIFIICYLLASCFARTIIYAQEKKLHSATFTIQLYFVNELNPTRKNLIERN